MFALLAIWTPLWSQSLGLFEGHNDIGTLTTPGTASYVATKHIYNVSSGGENMWAASDSFHFVWKKVSARDVALGADIAFATNSGNSHKKGVLMIRQSLDADSAYCDAALHLDGLTSLQCRERKGGPTFEIQQAIVGAKRLRLEKRGAKFQVFASNAANVEGQQLRFTGGSISVPMEGEFYIGLGVCAHDKKAFEQVEFSNVSIGPVTESQPTMTTLEVAPVRGDRRALHVEPGEIANPKWFADGKSIAFVAVPKQRMEIEIAKGAVAKSSEAGFSDPKGRVFAAKKRGKMHLYTESDGRKSWLTEGKSNNGDPRVTADGDALVFVSDRSGTPQLWRMSLQQGALAEPLTSDEEFANNRPFLSPDGLRVAFISTPKAKGEPSIRVMTLADKKIVSLARCNLSFGSWQSSPWSPDSGVVVFVTRY